jgi:hypothetical protein
VISVRLFWAYTLDGRPRAPAATAAPEARMKSRRRIPVPIGVVTPLVSFLGIVFLQGEPVRDNAEELRQLIVPICGFLLLFANISKKQHCQASGE